jgi:peptidoglycan/LPS O-acetylase OafA/YrhL
MHFDAAYWYLTSEVVFYALLPILVLKIRGLYGRLALFGALVAVAAVTQVFMRITFDAGLGYLPYYLIVFPTTHLWIFVAGALLRTFVERLKEKRPEGSWPTLAFSLFAGSLAFLVLLPYVPFLGKALASVEVTRTGLDQILGYREVVLFFAAVPFFVAAVLGSPVLSRILSWRLLALVGVISYSFYLLHDTFLLLAGRYILRSGLLRVRLRHMDGAELWLAYAGYLGVMVVVIGVIASLSYRYIESPFLRRRPK